MSKFNVVSFGVVNMSEGDLILVEELKFDKIEDLSDENKEKLCCMMVEESVFEGMKSVFDDENVKESVEKGIEVVWGYNEDLLDLVMDEEEIEEYKKDFDEKKELFLSKIGDKKECVEWSVEYDSNVFVIVKGDEKELGDMVLEYVKENIEE